MKVQNGPTIVDIWNVFLWGYVHLIKTIWPYDQYRLDHSDLNSDWSRASSDSRLDHRAQTLNLKLLIMDRPGDRPSVPPGHRVKQYSVGLGVASFLGKSSEIHFSMKIRDILCWTCNFRFKTGQSSNRKQVRSCLSLTNMVNPYFEHV